MASDVMAPSNPTKTSRIFSQRSELIFLLSTIVGLILAFVELQIFFIGGRSVFIFLRILSDVIFVGTIHAILSYALLWCLPEFKQWINEKTKNRPWRFWFGNLAVVATVLFASFLTIYVGQGRNAISYLLAIYFLFDFFGVRHLIQQFKGLSLQYNQQTRQGRILRMDQLKKLNFYEKIEKFLFDVLVYSSVLLQLGAMTTVIKLTWFNPFEVLWFGIIFNFLICAGLVILSAVQPGASSSFKSFFVLRVLLIPFRTVSIFANVVLRIFHGAEFMLLLKNILGNSKASRQQKMTFIWVGLVLLCIAATCTLFKADIFGRFVYSKSLREYPYFAIIVSMNTVFNFAHYFMDAQMFRFKDPINRKHIGGLIVLAPETQTLAPTDVTHHHEIIAVGR